MAVISDRLVGLVVKTPAFRAEDPGFEKMKAIEVEPELFYHSIKYHPDHMKSVRENEGNGRDLQARSSSVNTVSNGRSKWYL